MGRVALAVFKKLGFRIDIGSARGLAVKRAATWRSTCSKEGDRDFKSESRASRSPGAQSAVLQDGRTARARGSSGGSKDRDGNGELSSFGGGHVAELAHEKNCRAADNPLDGEQGLDGVGGKDRPLVGQPLLDVSHEVVVRGDPFGNFKPPRATQGWMCVGEEDRKVIRDPFAAGQVRVRWQRDARYHEAVQHRGLSGIEAVEPGGTGPGTRLSDVCMNGLEDFRNTKVGPGEGASEAGSSLEDAKWSAGPLESPGCSVRFQSPPTMR